MTVESLRPAPASSMLPELDRIAVPAARDSVETADGHDDLPRQRPGDLVDDWVAAPSCTSPSFGPDGSLAYVGNRSGRPALWLRDPAGDERLVDTGEAHVSSVIWSPDGAWIAIAAAPGGGERTEVRVVRPDGTGLRRLAGGSLGTLPGDTLSGDALSDGTLSGEVVTLPTGGAGAPSAAVPGRWTADSAWLAVCESVSTGLTHAYLVDPETGRRIHLAEGQALVVLDVFADPAYPARRLLLREGPRGVRRILLVDVVTGTCDEVVEPVSTVAFGRFAPDGQSVYLVTDADRNRPALVEVSLPGTGAPGAQRVLAARTDADVERFVLLPDSTAVGAGVGSAAGAVVLWNVAGRSELSLADLVAGRQRQLPPSPRDVVSSLLVAPEGRRLLLAAEGPTAPAELWTYDLANASAGYRCLVSHVPTAFPAPSLAAVDDVDRPSGSAEVGRLVRPVLRTFAAHDGLELSGWWYRPYGVQGPLPTVLYFHGGPESQERPTFNPLFQALATRGLAVFAPNVRGSSGYGRGFVAADDRERRFAGVADVAACVEFLVGSGLADSDRIGVAGRSYGGYLTLMALVTYPELFRVGVDVCGMADFETFYAYTEPWIAGPAVTKYGDPEADRALLRLLSPLHRMDSLAAPLLVVHGSNDTNVPVVEAEQTVAAVTARGLPCRYLLFEGEGHEVAGLANRTMFVREVVDWVSDHLLGSAGDELSEAV